MLSGSSSNASRYVVKEMGAFETRLFLVDAVFFKLVAKTSPKLCAGSVEIMSVFCCLSANFAANAAIEAHDEIE